MRSQLGQRLLAALVLMAVTLAALWVGEPVWAGLVALVGALMSWEWARLVGQGRFGPAGWVAMLAVFGATLYVGIAGRTELGLAALVAGAAVAALVEFAPAKSSERLWRAAGVFYVGLPSFALVWLRADSDYGFSTCLWLLALVWAIDTAAYFTGSTIGGPKLAPRISPKKTWAGLAGGCVGAGLIGAAAALWFGAGLGWLIALSAALALLEQLGDLAESAVKRHFGVKDSSGLIPGHGGMLDRVDGLVAVALGVAVLVLATGRSPLAP